METHESVKGFFATEPQISYERDIPRAYARFGVERHVLNPATGRKMRIEPTFHTLIAYWEAAEAIAQHFEKGDSFIAQGARIKNPETGKERFEVDDIGHNSKRTRYEIDRRPLESQRNRQEITQRPATAQDPVSAITPGANTELRRSSPTNAASQTGLSR